MKLKAMPSSFDLGRFLSIMLTFPLSPFYFSDSSSTVKQVSDICVLGPVSASCIPCNPI